MVRGERERQGYLKGEVLLVSLIGLLFIISPDPDILFALSYLSLTPPTHPSSIRAGNEASPARRACAGILPGAKAGQDGILNVPP